MCAARRRLFLPAFEKQGKIAYKRSGSLFAGTEVAGEAGFWWLVRGARQGKFKPEIRACSSVG
jgi:hypothetical protein